MLWHFVLTSTTTLNNGLLRADFTSAGLTSPDVVYFKSTHGGVTMWDIITPSADSVVNFSTDAVGDNLNLSHVCYLTSNPQIGTVAAGGAGHAGDTFPDTAP